MKASLPKVRKGSLDKTHVSCAANAMACFLIQPQPVN